MRYGGVERKKSDPGIQTLSCAFHAATVVLYKVRFFYCPFVFLLLATDFNLIAGKLNIPTCVPKKLRKTRNIL